MRGKCRLCHTEGEILESHIVPKSLFKWLKDTSATGLLRIGHTPNRPVQDGVKQYMLCAKCEQGFGNWEKIFKTRFFLPLSFGEARTFPYEQWLLKFTTSISWRVLEFYSQLGQSHLSPPQVALAERAREVWRQFLLGERKNPDDFQQHVLPLDMLVDIKDPTMPPNINSYLLRTVDLDILRSEKTAFVFSKVCRVLIIGFIQMPYAEKWRGTLVHVNKGVHGQSGRYRVPDFLFSILKDRARRLRAIHEQISDAQWDRIGRNYLKDIERTGGSETHRALAQDVKLFGDRAFVDKERTS